ncbi:MAG: type IV pilus biogenesis/stability protein PilW [Wenzhouxiangella sp.]
MIRSLRIPAIIVVVQVIVGCASTANDPGPTGNSGMDRVSPVRTAEINTRLGIGYFERDQLQVAMEKLQTALEKDPEHVPAHVTLAVIYERLGDERRAERHYERAVRYAPNDGATLNHYGAYLCQQGDYDQADEYFERATRDPFYDTPEVALTNSGSCARRNGDLDRAERQLRNALEIDAAYPDALYQLSRVYLEKDDPMRARAFLQRFEATGQTEPGALALGYRIEQELGNVTVANQYLARLEKDYPDSSEARELRQQNRDHD